jgi:chaperonin GroEL (HSP60 family)
MNDLNNHSMVICSHLFSFQSDLIPGMQWGLDLTEGTLRDSVAAGVLEPTMNKVKIIQFATEAALTILRIDDLIKVEKDPAMEDER